MVRGAFTSGSSRRVAAADESWLTGCCLLLAGEGAVPDVTELGKDEEEEDGDEPMGPDADDEEDDTQEDTTKDEVPKQDEQEGANAATGADDAEGTAAGQQDGGA